MARPRPDPSPREVALWAKRLPRRARYSGAGPVPLSSTQSTARPFSTLAPTRTGVAPCFTALPSRFFAASVRESRSPCTGTSASPISSRISTPGAVRAKSPASTTSSAASRRSTGSRRIASARWITSARLSIWSSRWPSSTVRRWMRVTIASRRVPSGSPAARSACARNAATGVRS